MLKLFTTWDFGKIRPTFNKLWSVLLQQRDMSVFIRRLNPLTGSIEWVVQNENYDFHQEIARSAFADMLHDTERNDKYFAGIKAAIQQKHREGKKARVLDIGTGTGLLSMMAAQCGADTIYACEAFSPISKCAELVILENGFADRITVIHKRSTDMTVGEEGDMPHKANILVTEVFDTELIGEGAIGTFNHAHKHLLKKNCLVVPTSGTVYAAVIESCELQRWNQLSPWGSLRPSNAIANCPGAAAVHDLQMSQITEKFRIIVPPKPVFRFDWSGSSIIPEEDTRLFHYESAVSGTADMIFMWWSLDMDPKGEVVLSCAPWWCHPSRPDSAESIQWRDHWMQAVYYLPAPVPFTEGQNLTLVSSHDEYSLWFNLVTDCKSDCRHLGRPVCECMLHVACSRTRLGMLNDPTRRSKYEEALKQLITPQSVVLSLGDTSLLGLTAATLGAAQVYHVEENVISREVMEGLVKDNNLQTKVTIVSSAILDKEITSSVNLVIGELFFANSLYPWDVLRWWFLRQQCPTATCMPVKATLHALPMRFDHLHKIRAPLGSVNGFKMTSFDKLVQASSDLSDNRVEVQPLWEYPGVCLSTPKELFSFDLTSSLPQGDVECKGSIPIMTPGTCHGVALWMDFHLTSEIVVSSGPQKPPVVGNMVVWDKYMRQGIFFLLPEVSIVNPGLLLDYKALFSPTTGDIVFNFREHCS